MEASVKEYSLQKISIINHVNNIYIEASDRFKKNIRDGGIL